MSMNRRTKLVPWIAGVAVTVLIGALAIPSQAADKVFSYTVIQPSPLLAGSTNQTLGVRVTNNTPSATINSFSVTVPTAFTVTGLPTQGGSTNSSTVPPNQSAVYGWNGQTVTVQFLDPIKQNKYFTLNIPVTVTSSNLNCGSNQVTWTNTAVTAYAGSNLSGNTFRTTSTPTTTITKTCSLSFTVQPSDVGKNTAISPAVEVTLSEAVSGVTVTMSKATGLGTLSGTLTATTNGSGVASFSDLKLDTKGSYTLQAAASGYGTATSSSFTVYDSTLTCGAAQTNEETTVTITKEGTTECSYPVTIQDDRVDIGKPNTGLDTDHFTVVVTWGLPADDYPSFGATTFSVNGVDFNNMHSCDVSGGEYQFPDASDTPPACVGATSTAAHHFSNPLPDGTDGVQVTETFLLAGDATLCRTCR